MAAGTLALVDQVVSTITVWQLCARDEGAHSPMDREVARGDRVVVERGLAHYPAGAAHLLRITSTTVAEPPAAHDPDSDPEPYDPFDPEERQDHGW